MALPAQAATGTVEPAHRYAWSSDGGWVNFAPTNGNVQITDTALTGYAWSQNDGWINLAPANGGVHNDGNGTLSGFAWDETAGWIDFTGVTIDSSGIFHGTALGAHTSITFDCTGCTVATTWSSAAAAPPPAPSSGGGVSSAPPSPAEGPTEPSMPATPSAPPDETPAQSDAPADTPRVVLTSPPSGTSGGDVSGKGKGSVSLLRLVPGYDGLVTAVQSGRMAFGDLAVAIIPVEHAVVPPLLATGAAVGALGFFWSLLSTLKAISDIPLLVLRSLSALLPLATLGRKRRFWGTVYDSRTRRPLDPAVVTLKDTLGKDVKTAVTDLDGRYAFLAPAGTYTISAVKSHHVFPASFIAAVDPIYSQPYLGGPVTLAEPGMIARDIPLDPVEFDWNEFEKYRTWRYQFFSRFDKPLAYASLWLVPLGTVIALFDFLTHPNAFDGFFLAFYLVLSALYLLGFHPRAYGQVKGADGAPLQFAAVKAHYPDQDQAVAATVTDQLGRYHLLLPNEKAFDITVEQPTGPATYTTVLRQRFTKLHGRLNRTLVAGPLPPAPALR